MGVSKNGGTQQPWVFLLKMIIFGCEMGVPSLKETPIWLIYRFREHTGDTWFSGKKTQWNASKVARAHNREHW